MNEIDSKRTKTIIIAYVVGFGIGFLIGVAVTASIMAKFIDPTKF